MGQESVVLVTVLPRGVQECVSVHHCSLEISVTLVSVNLNTAYTQCTIHTLSEWSQRSVSFHWIYSCVHTIMYVVCMTLTSCVCRIQQLLL